MNSITEDRIGLVIKSTNSTAKCISIIRKYNPVSMGEIKSNLESGNFVIDCDYTSDSGIRKIRRCYDELVKAGTVVEIYEDGDITTREFISNLLDTYQEIAEETQQMIDEEVAAEGGDED